MSSASNLLIFSEEIERDLKRKTFIRKVSSHEKEQTGKHYIYFNSFVLTMVGSKWGAMATLYVLCILVFISLSHVLRSLVW